MKKRKKKNAITLLALVITIVIMLLLAGIAIQMTMGENGLIAKSVQAQKEQAKAELYDTAKLSYMSLNAKALENGQPSPQAELALSTTEFINKYNVVGDDVTDKKGTVIDTKANVLNIIQGTVVGGFTPGTINPAESWPKTVGGVTIPEEEKNDMIWKLKIKNNATVYFGSNTPSFFGMDPIEIDYGNGEKEEITDLYNSHSKEYSAGEYILKLKNIRDFTIYSNEDYEIEIVQWGKILEKNEENFIQIPNVIKIYEPEPDKVPIKYVNAKFTEIPEWLFSKKVTSKVMSRFSNSTGLTSIPEGLFKNNVNAVDFDETFMECTGLTSIPEELFKNNVNAEYFSGTFIGCTGLTSIPEGLFKNNVNAKKFNSTFIGCTGLTSIPEGLFKNNVNAIGFYDTFAGGTGLTSIPEGLFKNNVKAEYFNDTFRGCTGITSIPEGLFENNVNVIDFYSTFIGCTGLTSIPEGLFKNNVNTMRIWNTFEGCTGLTSIPEGLFKNNVNVTKFWEIFEGCTGLTNIPEGLFKNNVNAIEFNRMFSGCIGLTSIPEGLLKNNVNAVDFPLAFGGCTGLTSIPEKIIELGKKVKERGGNVSRMFYGCTSASNYASIPNYMK